MTGEFNAAQRARQLRAKAFEFFHDGKLPLRTHEILTVFEHVEVKIATEMIRQKTDAQHQGNVARRFEQFVHGGRGLPG